PNPSAHRWLAFRCSLLCTLEREPSSQERPARGRLEPKRPARKRHALPHPRQPKSLGPRVDVEALPVVLNLDHDVALVQPNGYPGEARVGMLDDVRERLLHQPVDGRFKLRREMAAAVWSRELELALDDQCVFPAA